MTRAALLLGLCGLVAISPSVARPNGAPDVEVVYGSAGGSLTPLQETTIRLVSERLLIDWTTDPTPARAEYQLDNPGPERTLRFGVPLLWHESAIRPDPLYADPMEPVKAGARGISISVGGRRHGASSPSRRTRAETRHGCRFAEVLDPAVAEAFPPSASA